MELITKKTFSEKLSDYQLKQPKPMRGGSYISYLVKNDKNVYVQVPKCSTKQGFIKSGKKMYCDLLFSSTNDEHLEFIQWIENLESKCHNLIFDKTDMWFNEDFDLNDIETNFTSPIRIYKSGKFYLLRVQFNNMNKNIDCTVYNENEELMDINNVKESDNILSLLHFKGVRFTTKSFHFDIVMKQIMVFENENEQFKKCLIKKDVNQNDKHLEKEGGNNENNGNEDDINEEKNEPNLTLEIINVDTNLTNDLEENDVVQKDLEENKEENDDVQKENNLLLLKNKDNDDSDIKKEIDTSTRDVNDNVECQIETEAVTLNENDLHNSIPMDKNNHGGGGDESNGNESNGNGLIDGDNDEHEIELNGENKHIGETNKETLEDLTNSNDNSNDLDINLKNDLEKLKPLDIDIDNLDNGEIKLKEPNEVYIEIYRAAREKAKKARKMAVETYLEAMNIKNTYMLDDIDSSDDEFNLDELTH